MAYQSRKPIKWAELLAHPKDHELLKAERTRKAYTKAWSESANERDGRVVVIDRAGQLSMAYDHRAELINETAPDKATLRRQVHQARQNRAQVITPQGNRHISGN